MLLKFIYYMCGRNPLHSPTRPLPKPKLTPDVLQPPPEHGAHIAERSPPPVGLANRDSMVSFVFPQRPTNVEEIRRGNLSKLRRHLGKSIPPDLIPPRLDRDEASDSSSSGGEQDAGPPSAPIIPKCPPEVTKGTTPILEESTMIRYSHRWLMEKKGIRREEDDYSLILRRLRELR
jgi:hypothetical protein